MTTWEGYCQRVSQEGGLVLYRRAGDTRVEEEVCWSRHEDRTAGSGVRGVLFETPVYNLWSV